MAWFLYDNGLHHERVKILYYYALDYDLLSLRNVTAIEI